MAGSTETVVKPALLLNDVISGEKGSSFLIRQTENVLKGSLLTCSSENTQSTPDGKPAHTYSVYKDDTTLLCCPAQDIAPLTDREFQLLSGITKPGARYDAYIGDTLDWGLELRVDATVYVRQSTQGAITKVGAKAVVRWIGVLPGETGLTFGIETMVICCSIYL